ncbi:MAG: diguanylate cyclase [Magnetococcales bacterium]|nr:diguanylate cyclase [Magnetococcales bacterium]
MGILIAHQSMPIRQELEALLREEGFGDLVIANSLGDVYRILGLDDPGTAVPGLDLILVDGTMREGEGRELCHEIRNAEHTRDVPIIALTSQESVERLAMLFSAGAVDYLNLPVVAVELAARVRSALRLKQEMDTRKARELELLEVTRKLAEANRKLQKLIFLDGLTGIANRRYLDEFLQKEWRRAARQQEKLALMLVDIDYFKRFNDTYGHQAGDATLRGVAETLERTLKRPGDLVARYGGEEFAVVLSEIGDGSGAAQVGENLRAAVEALAISHECSEVAKVVTLSIGVTVASPQPGDGPGEAVQLADEALYQAKRLGRNRVVTG